MGLFDKKECSICGGRIGLLDNKKLKDGNMCKDCAGKLSVWFQDRSESTVAYWSMKQTVDGKQVSYNPRHMVYMVQFSVTIRIKGHPFIKTMTVPLNDGAIHIRNMGERMEAEYNSPDYAYGFKIDRATNWEQIQGYQRFLSMAEEIKSVRENY